MFYVAALLSIYSTPPFKIHPTAMAPLRNLKIFSTKFLKVKMKITPQLIDELFKKNSPVHNLRRTMSLIWKIKRQFTVVLNHCHFCDLKLGISIIPEEIKNCQTLLAFKRKIKSWVPRNCPCQLCKTFKQQVGFI